MHANNRPHDPDPRPTLRARLYRPPAPSNAAVSPHFSPRAPHGKQSPAAPSPFGQQAPAPASFGFGAPAAAAPAPAPFGAPAAAAAAPAASSFGAPAAAAPAASPFGTPSAGVASSPFGAGAAGASPFAPAPAGRGDPGVLRAWMQEVYAKFKPENVPKIDRLLVKYA